MKRISAFISKETHRDLKNGCKKLSIICKYFLYHFWTWLQNKFYSRNISQKSNFLVWIVLVCSCIDDVSDDEREPLKSFVQLVDDNVEHVENVLRDSFSVDYLPCASSSRLCSWAANDIWKRFRDEFGGVKSLPSQASMLQNEWRSRSATQTRR